MRFNLDRFKFNADGLIPVIVQDNRTNEVLMMAYMNREALAKTLSSGETWFFSRSRQELWHKGETSGNVQEVDEVYFDCDADTLLIKVRQHGAACHQGYKSCFHYRIEPDGRVGLVGELVFNPAEVYGDKGPPPETRPRPKETKPVCICGSSILEEVYEVILDRKHNRVPGAYTSYLFDKGLDTMLQKLGEESTEVLIASKNRKREEVIKESADVIYHLMVLLAAEGIDVREVFGELASRKR
ncbi:MAG: bifunctional phosphoribosyl-AMP cyclohydrolase/phosphoribosyl-ATP diphosphatase HisIE [Bacillota bacterium]